MDHMEEGSEAEFEEYMKEINAFVFTGQKSERRKSRMNQEMNPFAKKPQVFFGCSLNPPPGLSPRRIDRQQCAASFGSSFLDELSPNEEVGIQPRSSGAELGRMFDLEKTLSNFSSSTTGTIESLSPKEPISLSQNIKEMIPRELCKACCCVFLSFFEKEA